MAAPHSDNNQPVPIGHLVASIIGLLAGTIAAGAFAGDNIIRVMNGQQAAVYMAILFSLLAIVSVMLSALCAFILIIRKIEN